VIDKYKENSNYSLTIRIKILNHSWMYSVMNESICRILP
jgi:hypothetical protein